MAVDPKKQQELGSRAMSMYDLDNAFGVLKTSIEGNLEKPLEKATVQGKDFAKEFIKDLESGLGRSQKGLEGVDKITNKIAKGQDATKDIEKERAKIEKES